MIVNGSRVMVFDWRAWRDDQSTPLSVTVKPATVVCRYGKRCSHGDWVYDDLVDVLFDDGTPLSKGHFTRGVNEIVDE